MRANGTMERAKVLAQFVMDKAPLPARSEEYRPEHFATLLRHVSESLSARGNLGVRLDSASSLIPQRQVEQIIEAVLRDEHAPRYSERYVPMESGGVAPWAEAYLQKRVTRRGIADYVTSADMPWFNVEMQEIARKVHTTGGKIGWDYFEMQRAAFAGVPLSDELVWAARQGAEDARDIILIEGDAGLPSGGGLIRTGIINDPTVPTMPAPAGSWLDLEPDELLEEVRAILTAYREQNHRREVADTLLLPEAQIGFLELKRLTDTGVSLKKYLLENVDGLKDIAVLPQLAGAGANGADRAILYAKNTRVVRGVVPMPFQFLSPQESDLKMVIFGVERIVGTEIRFPLGMLYIDGI